MELKKQLAVALVMLEMGGALMTIGAGPATQPATPPAARPSVLPSARTPALPGAAGAQDNSLDNTRGRLTRRTRGTGNGNSNGFGGGGSVSLASDPFAAVKSRSIFLKGNQTLVQDRIPIGTGPRPTEVTGVEEGSLIFNGVIIVDDEPDALIENLKSGNVVKIRPGDGVAGGRVSAITFDDLAYERRNSTNTMHVAIGQNLQGVTVYTPSPAAPPARVPVPAAPDGQSPAGLPGVGGSPVVPSGSSGELSTTDVEAKLKARRLQESGGK